MRTVVVEDDGVRTFVVLGFFTGVLVDMDTDFCIVGLDAIAAFDSPTELLLAPLSAAGSDAEIFEFTFNAFGSFLYVGVGSFPSTVVLGESR
jgi:hypothetical protein